MITVVRVDFSRNAINSIYRLPNIDNKAYKERYQELGT